MAHPWEPRIQKAKILWRQPGLHNEVYLWRSGTGGVHWRCISGMNKSLGSFPSTIKEVCVSVCLWVCVFIHVRSMEIPKAVTGDRTISLFVWDEVYMLLRLLPGLKDPPTSGSQESYSSGIWLMWSSFLLLLSLRRCMIHCNSLFCQWVPFPTAHPPPLL